LVTVSRPAQLPPVNLHGLDRKWSKIVDFTDLDGIPRGVHVLDTGTDRAAVLTLVCVHGNPTWSYLWRNFLRQAPINIRVIAVDQLGMGYSERLSSDRVLEQRVDDLTRVVAALEVTTPIVSLAHDWGGPISLGWVENVIRSGEHQIAGLILLNTAVHQPKEFNSPAIIRLARARGLLAPVTEYSQGFVLGTRILSGKKMSRDVAIGFRAPYRKRESRKAIHGFVADIPFEEDHVSRAPLDHIAESLNLLCDTPILMCWGPNDPVFSDLYLRDLKERLPHAVVHRYEGASHLVSEDAPTLVGDIFDWIGSPSGTQSTFSSESDSDVIDLGAAMREQSSTRPDAIGLTAMSDPGSLTWQELDTLTNSYAGYLSQRGVTAGDRVALLVPPGPLLIPLIYAIWNLGAAVVLADSGLGLRGIFRALRGAHVDHVVGIPRAGPLMKSLHIRGARISTKEIDKAQKLPRTVFDTDQKGTTQFPATNLGAVVFTSGSTGPAKGVQYSRGQIARTVTALQSQYTISSRDVIIAAFSPWAVFGPALGIASVLPRMDPGKPSSLTFEALKESVVSAAGTLLWASPAALINVLDTAPKHNDADWSSIRLILSAGAPVPKSLLQRLALLIPHACIRTPYGMTEALPISETDLEAILKSQSDQGVLVGKGIPGVDICIAAWDAPDQLTTDPQVMGEIVVRAPHMKNSYDGLEFTERSSSYFMGWHRTGDVGHLDTEGFLWIEGRKSHVISTSFGVITPVPVEQRIESLPFVRQAACVGIGPRGGAVVAIVYIETTQAKGLSQMNKEDEMRAIAGVPLAAMLRVKTLPTDIRHNAKLNREKIAEWANAKLAGNR
jgi:acyl-coenzyme A synthetase/AMP-(fatty) acid ligase/pimeloyl-ACP methyl ester carboxylesterase